jgi:hypothetical protein
MHWLAFSAPRNHTRLANGWVPEPLHAWFWIPLVTFMILSAIGLEIALHDSNVNSGGSGTWVPFPMADPRGIFRLGDFLFNERGTWFNLCELLSLRICRFWIPTPNSDELILFGKDTTSRHCVYDYRCTMGIGSHRDSNDAAVHWSCAWPCTCRKEHFTGLYAWKVGWFSTLLVFVPTFTLSLANSSCGYQLSLTVIIRLLLLHWWLSLHLSYSRFPHPYLSSKIRCGALIVSVFAFSSHLNEIVNYLVIRSFQCHEPLFYKS